MVATCFFFWGFGIGISLGLKTCILRVLIGNVYSSMNINKKWRIKKLQITFLITIIWKNPFFFFNLNYQKTFQRWGNSWNRKFLKNILEGEGTHEIPGLHLKLFYFNLRVLFFYFFLLRILLLPFFFFWGGGGVWNVLLLQLDIYDSRRCHRYVLLLLLKMMVVLLSYRQNKSNVYKVGGIIEMKNFF